MTLPLDTIVCSDALELCHAIADAGIQADMILADLPYGTTACAWDTVIPFAPMWEAFKRVIKPRGAIVLTASQPFTSALVMSNPTWFRYDFSWRKSLPTGHLNAKKMPLRKHEDILVFSDGMPIYFPQFSSRTPHGKTKNGPPAGAYSEFGKGERVIPLEHGYPTSALAFNTCYHDGEAGLHPTQKPVALFRYLIRTYTLPSELVLDPTCGSGTAAIAARQEGRHWLCGDSSAEYVEIAQERLAEPYTPDMFVLAETAVNS